MMVSDGSEMNERVMAFGMTGSRRLKNYKGAAQGRIYNEKVVEKEEEESGERWIRDEMSYENFIF